MRHVYRRTWAWKTWPVSGGELRLLTSADFRDESPIVDETGFNASQSFAIVLGDQYQLFPDLPAVASTLAAAGIRFADTVLGKEADFASDFSCLFSLGFPLCDRPEACREIGILLERHLPKLVDGRYLEFLTVCNDEAGDMLYRNVQIDLDTFEAKTWIACQDFPVSYDQLPRTYRVKAGGKIKSPEPDGSSVVIVAVPKRVMTVMEATKPNRIWPIGYGKEIQIFLFPDYATGVPLSMVQIYPGVYADCVMYDCPVSYLVVVGQERTLAPDLPALARRLAEIDYHLVDYVVGKEIKIARDFAEILEVGETIVSMDARYGFTDSSILPHIAKERYLVFVTMAIDEDMDLLYRRVMIDLESLEAQAEIAVPDITHTPGTIVHPYDRIQFRKIKAPLDVTASGISDPLQMRTMDLRQALFASRRKVQPPA